MNNPYLIGIISWLLPGVGHLMQGRFVRGIIIGVVIWTMFIVAIFSGGAYYISEGLLLYLNIFARFGNGLGALISYYLATSPPPNIASWATYEYGGKFLEIAGLLNYMAVMDAVDISFGRKK